MLEFWWTQTFPGTFFMKLWCNGKVMHFRWQRNRRGCLSFALTVKVLHIMYHLFDGYIRKIKTNTIRFFLLINGKMLNFHISSPGKDGKKRIIPPTQAPLKLLRHLIISRRCTQTMELSSQTDRQRLLRHLLLNMSSQHTILMHKQKVIYVLFLLIHPRNILKSLKLRFICCYNITSLMSQLSNNHHYMT